MLRHPLCWSVLVGLALAGLTPSVSAQPAAMALTDSERQGRVQEASKLIRQIIELAKQRQYAKATPLGERALALLESVRGPEHPEVAAGLTLVAGLYTAQNQYEKAEPLYLRALAIQEKAYGSEHPNVAQVLNLLAGQYYQQSRYEEAAPLFQRVLSIREKSLGREHPDVAQSLNNLGELYASQGQYEKAEPLLQRVLAIREKVLGSEHPNVAASLSNLGTLYIQQGQYQKAELLLQRALTIYEKVYGAEHPDVAQTLNNLAGVYRDQREYQKAETLYQRALAIDAKVYGLENPQLAKTLNNLAVVYVDQGQYQKAELYYLRTLAIFEKGLGSEHPYITSVLNNLKALYWIQNNIPATLDSQSRALNMEEAFLSRELNSGSEERKRSILSTLQVSWEATISFNQQAAANNAKATQLALSATLQRKGRVLDALANNLATLRRDLTPADQKLLDQISAVRARLANLYLAGLGQLTPEQYRANLDALKQRNEQLESALASRSASFRNQTQPITIAAVQKQLPRDAVLIEFVRYRPFNPKANQFGKAHYAAYLLSATGSPTSVDLGSAQTIDELVGQFRDVVKDPNASLETVRTLGRKLHTALMVPMQSQLARASRLLISPDGQLNLIPFSALVDVDNRYLVQKYAVSYLTSGRDLLRLNSISQPSTSPVIVANPDFVKATVAAASAKDNRRSTDLRSLSFNPLPGTAGEAKAITPLLPSALVLTGTAATETALKAVQAPRILHIATHGFFLPDQSEASLTSTRGGIGIVLTSPEKFDGVKTVDLGENPLLRSGLALAGANQKTTSGDDGLLTALEVANLNLQGTELVVLSACETGIGSVTNGEGVYGLRRALVLAGSRTQVVSLWQVSDLGTQELMTGFYRQLQKGSGKEEALRKEQVRLISSNQYAHPFYWAAFLLNGDWR
jgi:CHAT domain-containing protein/Tfp pilus assembly protein PilF